MASQDFLFDKRVLGRNVAKGLVDAKVVQKTLSSLPDRADNVALTSVDALDNDLDTDGDLDAADADDGADDESDAPGASEGDSESEA